MQIARGRVGMKTFSRATCAQERLLLERYRGESALIIHARAVNLKSISLAGRKQHQSRTLSARVASEAKIHMYIQESHYCPAFWARQLHKVYTNCRCKYFPSWGSPNKTVMRSVKYPFGPMRVCKLCDASARVLQPTL